MRKLLEEINSLRKLTVTVVSEWKLENYLCSAIVVNSNLKSKVLSYFSLNQGREIIVFYAFYNSKLWPHKIR